VIQFGDSGAAVLNESVVTSNNVDGPVVFSPLSLFMKDTRVVGNDQDSVEAGSIWLEDSVIQTENGVALRLLLSSDETDNRISSSMIIGNPAVESQNVEGLEILASRIRGEVDSGDRTLIKDSHFSGQGWLEIRNRSVITDSVGAEIDLYVGSESIISGNSFRSFQIQDTSRVVGNRSEYELYVGPEGEIIDNRINNGELRVFDRSLIRDNYTLRLEVSGGSSLIENNQVNSRAFIYDSRNTVRWNNITSLNILGSGNLVFGNGANSITGPTGSSLFGPIISDFDSATPHSDHPNANFLLSD